VKGTVETRGKFKVEESSARTVDTGAISRQRRYQIPWAGRIYITPLRPLPASVSLGIRPTSGMEGLQGGERILKSGSEYLIELREGAS